MLKSDPEACLRQCCRRAGLQSQSRSEPDFRYVRINRHRISAYFRPGQRELVTLLLVLRTRYIALPLNKHLPIAGVLCLLPVYVSNAQPVSDQGDGLHIDAGTENTFQRGNVFDGLLGAYREVYELTQAPPEDPELTNLCQSRVAGEFVTFIGLERSKPFIVAVTERRLRDPSEDITLEPLYVTRSGPSEIGGIRRLPSPVGYDPRAKAPTMDWAYILDRNSDGRIDYLAYLESPMPIVPVEHEGELPVVTGVMTGAAYKLAVASTEMVFWHLSDDDFDNHHDGVAVPLRDEHSGWIDRVLLARDSKFDGKYAACAYFDVRTLEHAGACVESNAGWRVPGKQLKGIGRVPPDLSLFETINRGASSCRLEGGNFYATAQELKGDPHVYPETPIRGPDD